MTDFSDTARTPSRLYRVAIVAGITSALAVACGLDWTVVPVSSSPANDAVSTPIDSVRVEAGNDARTLNVYDAQADVDATRLDEDMDANADADADVADSNDADASVACSKGHACPTGSYCRYPDRLCGEERVGQCVPEPKNCGDAGLAVVCGCDGATHTSACSAAASGVDVSLGGCALPAKTFACGDRVCADGDYCSVTGTGNAATYDCRSAASCTLCVCVLGCAGGTCGTENGHLVARCP